MEGHPGARNPGRGPPVVLSGGSGSGLLRPWGAGAGKLVREIPVSSRNVGYVTIEVGRRLLPLGEAEGTHRRDRRAPASHVVVRLAGSRSSFRINSCGRANMATDTYCLPPEWLSSSCLLPKRPRRSSADRSGTAALVVPAPFFRIFIC